MAHITRITDKLFFGALDACRHTTDDGFAVVHACKSPCHQSSVGYSGNLPNTHQHYLAYEKPHHLYLNLIDPSAPLFMPESFARFFEFCDREIKERALLIHCNQGESRAPSLALLYMAKRLGLLPNDSYDTAKASFEPHYPYNPGKGIQTFLRSKWTALG